MASKFVVFQTTEGEKAVVFPASDFYHDQMASFFDDYEVISAGFVQLTKDGKVHCFGMSESLGIGSRGADDEFIIYRQLTAQTN